MAACSSCTRCFSDLGERLVSSSTTYTSRRPFQTVTMSAVAWQTLHLAQHLSNSHPAPLPGCVVSPPWPLAPVYLTGEIFFYLTASSYYWNTQIQSLELPRSRLSSIFTAPGHGVTTCAKHLQVSTTLERQTG